MVKSVVESTILGLSKPEHITESFVNLEVAKIQDICKSQAIQGSEKKSLLLKAVSFIDLTSLNADDTTETIETLCSKAINPLGDDVEYKNLHTAAVCVFQERAQDAINFLKSKNITDIAVATVAGDFPTAKRPYKERLQEVVKAGQLDVDEVDIVINRSLVVNENWEELFRQISEMRRACGQKHMKTILSIGDLPGIDHVYKASMVAMSAGSDFIKTSTGKESVNATLEAGIVMCEAIKEFQRLTGRKVGLKPAGGIKVATQALQWLTLVKENLGQEWFSANLFRIGASSLLDDLVSSIKLLS